MARIIAVTGGIGSGKSVVSEILRVCGHEVYDCDSEARRLMDCSTEIHRRIADEISPSCVAGGVIDRAALSEIVFAEADKLGRLNDIVHSHVRADIARRAASLADDAVLFVETAILYESRLDRMADEVWQVDAPEELRIERVMRRSGLSEAQVRARIEAQRRTVPGRPHARVHIIINDGFTPVLPRIEELLHNA